MNKRAAEWLPEDLKIAINTFMEQFYIMEEHNLEFIPNQYTINLLEAIAKYPEHNELLLDLIGILKEE